MSGMVRRAVVAVALLLAATLVGHGQAARAGGAFAGQEQSPTQGTPVPGGVLTADLGTWNHPPDPDSHEFQWLRDGAPIGGATARDYVVQAADVGHQVAPRVTARRGGESASFTGTALTVRKLGSSITVDVRRVRPNPQSNRLVWTAISFLSTERPWTTDGGTVVAYRKRDRRWKELGQAAVGRGAAFVRLPWKEAPDRRTKVRVCYLGSDAVEVSCSPYDVVRPER